MRVAICLALLTAFALSACSQPRAHARIRITPNGVTVAPAVSTSIGGIGMTVTQ
ncbi:MAG: hypothetical protein WA784_00230 [Albidovulum sp.]|jgi:hypothetical protein